MAANTQNAEQQIESLVARAETARRALSSGMQTLRHKADVPARIKQQLRAHPAIWFGTAALGGLVLARLIRRKPTPSSSVQSASAKPSSIRRFAFQTLFSAAKPMLQTWLTQQLKKKLVVPIPKITNSPIAIARSHAISLFF